MRFVNNLLSVVIYLCCVCSLIFTVKPLIVQAKQIVINLDKEMEEEDALQDRIFKIADVDSEDYSDYENTDSISEDTEDNAEDMINNEWEVMIIFCFGLLAGIIVGHFLTGFIK